MKRAIFLFLILAAMPEMAFAITPTTATIGSLSDLQAVQITTHIGTVYFAVDVNADAGIGNQGAAVDPNYIYYNGATGWNSPCFNYSNLGLIPVETCTSTNVALPQIVAGFHIRIYDTSNPVCYTAWTGATAACTGQPYLDIEFPSVGGGGGGGGGNPDIVAALTALDANGKTTVGFSILAIAIWLGSQITIAAGSLADILFSFRYVVAMMLIIGAVLSMTYKGLAYLRKI